MSTNTIRLHRVLRATPERVYRAFLDSDAMAKWLPPNGFTGKVHHLDAKVGGTYKMSFTNFATGHGHSFGGEYLDLVPASNLAAFALDIVLITALYVVLKPVNRNLALLAAFWGLIETAILVVALLSDLEALRLLSGAEYLRAFEADRLQALARLAIG